MIVNAEGELITPSVVYFSESEVVVGKNARTAITAHPGHGCPMGQARHGSGILFSPHPRTLPSTRSHSGLHPAEAEGRHRAVRLVADVQAVITVPAYFDELRRKATADAGEMAGLRVLDIVNEPTAAAIAFGEALGYLNEVNREPEVRAPSDLTDDEALGYLSDGPRPGSMSAGATAKKQDLNVLVYDLGGGTFDVTLLRLSAGKVQTLATDGDVQLGGHDWDQRLVDYAVDAFIKANGLDPRKDPAMLNRLFLDAMEAKHTLTARNRATMQVNFEGRSTEAIVTREQFEEMSADLLERTAYTSRQVLAVAGLEWKDLQRVLLVGGSTRMPMVGAHVAVAHGNPTRSHRQPRRSGRPRRRSLCQPPVGRTGRREAASTFRVTNVNAHSLGIEGIETDTLRKRNVVLIPRNTALPARHMERFATKSEGQRSIVIKVLEGESPQPGECIAIGRTVVRDLPAGLPKGWPVEVTFEYGTNGRWTVEAIVPGTDHLARLELVRDTGLSSEGLNRWKPPIDSAGGIDTFEAAAEDLWKQTASCEPGQSGIGGATEWSRPATRSKPAPGVPAGRHSRMVGGLTRRGS